MNLHLAVDACSLAHAKALHGHPPIPSGLEVVELLAASGVGLVTSNGVRTDAISVSLTETIAAWEKRGLLTTPKVPPVAVKGVRSRCPKKLKLPGNRDLGLIALAESRLAAVLSHDDALAALARHLGLVVVDLLDLGELARRRDLLPMDGLDAIYDPWNEGHAENAPAWARGAWRPDDWSGSATSTLAARTHLERIMARLLARL